MNHARAQSILSGQSRLAQRVFSAVPIQAFWDVQQISAEISRLGAHNLSKAEITGCLRTLVEAGLINETASLTFRSAVKPPKESPVTAPTPKPVAPKKTLMEQLFAVASTMRAAAEEIENLAMEVDTAIVEAGQGNEKLKQLQATLRGLMGSEA